MPVSVSKYLPRHNGTTKKIDFEERPICKYCKKPMKIFKTSELITVVGLLENYDVQRVSYRCGQALCAGGEEPSISPENLIYPPKSDYDYEVYAKVNQMRWKDKSTYEEIITKMEEQFGIILNLATIERMLKLYEIGCSEKYRPKYIKKIKENGGILLTIDGMKPLKGNPGLYASYDYFTDLAIHSKRLKSESTRNIVKFINTAKERIERELGVEIIGIISDALPAQRKAINIALPNVPHCLCHYHFYKFVFNAPKKLDNNLMTQILIFLGNLYYLRKSTIYANKGKVWEPNYSFTQEILDILRALSKWKARPKDPFFVGLELYSRLKDVYSILDSFIEGLDGFEGNFEDKRVISDLHLKIREFIDTKKEVVAELERIKGYLAKIKVILDDPDSSADDALEELENYSATLGNHLSSGNCGEVEGKFISELQNYLKDKGDLLFNFKRIEGAPHTNNSHELAFKQLKHFIRRIIGFRTANYYLLTHGERIIFVNRSESFEGILEILITMDHQKARELIRSERTSRGNIRFIIHDPQKWALNLEYLKQKCKELLELLLMKN